jgi:Uncharacterized protein conserved in bacteria (DUF2188)
MKVPQRRFLLIAVKLHALDEAIDRLVLKGYCESRRHAQRKHASDRAFAPAEFGKPPSVPNGEVHVLPSDKSWRVEVDDEERARSVHSTQAEAIASAREIARGSGRELYIHGRDGQIRDHLFRGEASRTSPANLLRLAKRHPVPAWSLALAAIVVIVGVVVLSRIARERWN